jgi:spermidine/putrescine-binding protein
MVWEGYTDTLFTRPFEQACGVKVNATYMGSSDDLVAKLRAGGAETIDLISPSRDAATAIIEAGLASPSTSNGSPVTKTSARDSGK